MKETDKLFECRNCGGVAATSYLSCPYCDSSDAGEVEYEGIDGETHTQKRSWFRIVELC